jgi:hypothetical protein
MVLETTARSDMTGKRPMLRAGIGLGAIALLILGIVPVLPIPNAIYDFIPLSLITVVPVFLAGGIFGGILAALLAPVCFFCISHRIVERDPRPSHASIAFFVVVLGISIISCIADWGSTVKFTTLVRAISLAIQSFLPPLILASAFLMSRQRLTVPRSLALHWLGLAWFTWSAIPWWGELL